MKRINIVIIIGLLAFFAGCKQSLISHQNYLEHTYEVVHADSNYSMSMSELYESLYNSDFLNNGGVIDTFVIRSYIDSIITDTLTGLDALSTDISEHYNQHRLFKLRYYEFLIRQYLNKMVYEKSVVDSVEVVAFYNSREDLFKIKEVVNLYHIALTKNSILNGSDSMHYRNLSEEELNDAMNYYADSIKGLITSPEMFSGIAEQFSEDVVTARQGGYLGWTNRDKHPDPFDSIAFSLEVGEIGGPYEDNNGWHIIMIDEHYPAGVPPINENLYIAAEKSLKTEKSNAIGQKLIDSLFADYDIAVNEDILDKDLYVVNGQTWVAVINGIDTIDCNEARSMELNYRNRYNVKNSTPDMKRQMFTTIGEKYLIVQAARNSNLEDISEIKAYRQNLWHKYARTIIDKSIYDPLWKPSDSLVEEYYYAHKEEFEVKKPLKVQHIIVSDSIFGEFLKDQAMSGIDFMELAKEHYPGEKSIRTELADLGYIGPTDVSKEFFEAALQTGLGEVSSPVKTEFGYHIIKVIERKTALDIAQAKRLIVPALKSEHRVESFKKYKNEIFKRYHVVYTGKLNSIHLKPKELRK